MSDDQTVVRILISSLTLLFSLLACGEVPSLKTYEAVGLSSVMKIDRIYGSMEGPQARIRRLKLQTGPQELLWITGYQTKVVDADGGPISQEFMCHNNLDLNWDKHAAAFGWKKAKRKPPRLYQLPGAV